MADLTLDDIVNSIYGQESGHGRNTRTSVTGARGGMQIQPATFAQYAKPGEDINSPADNMTVGRRIIADLYEKAHGDPARIAVGYFSGPGNMAPPGSPTPYLHNYHDPNGKYVASYVNDVTGRLGQAPVSIAARPAAATAPNEASIAARANVMPEGGVAVTALQQLTAKDEKTGKSKLDSILPDKKKGEGQQAAAVEAPPLAPAVDPMASMAPGAQALFSQVLAQSAKPLSWSSRPYGWDAGPQVPGTSMNTMGGQIG
jgi:hypothetical protein